MNDSSSQPPPIEPNPTSQVPPCPFQSFRSAWDRGTRDARQAAEEAAPRIKSAAVEAAYWLTYGLSYAAVFQVTLAKKFTPESVKKGFREGSQHGEDAANRFAGSADRTSEARPPMDAPAGAS